MSYNNGFISAPVSIYDVQKTLGVSSSDLGTLCRSAYVNKWAKYKPVPIDIINTTPQLKSDKTWDDQATWWKAKNGKCGLSYTSQTSIGDVKTNIDYKRVVWGRTIPTGNYAEPYRLLDFNEYNHRAFPPTYAIAATDAQMKTGETLDITVSTSTDDGYSLRFSHIGVFDNYYYTAAIYDTSDNLIFVFSAPKKVSQYVDGENIVISIPFSNTQTGGYTNLLTEGHFYKAYVFISSVNYSQVTQPAFISSGVYVPLPCGEGDYGLQPASFKCVDDIQWASIDAYCPLNGVIVNWTVDLYGAGTPSNTTLRLIHLNGTPVTSRESVAPSTTIDFSTGATAITSSDGRTAGWRKTSRPLTTLQLPSAAPDPELYKVEFVALNINTKAIIRRDLSPSV